MKEIAVVSDNRIGLSRRQLFWTGSAAGLGAYAASTAITPRPARAQPKTLRILQWKHFVPAYDRWFNDTYVKEWGQKNDTEVIVENVGIADLPGRVLAEAQSQQGHDLVMLLTPPAAF